MRKVLDLLMVPEAGLEPARVLPQRILNPSCLPISPLWHCYRAGLCIALAAPRLIEARQYTKTVVTWKPFGGVG